MGTTVETLEPIDIKEQTKTAKTTKTTKSSETMTSKKPDKIVKPESTVKTIAPSEPGAAKVQAPTTIEEVTITPTKKETEINTEVKNEETGHFDVSQHVYDGVKNVWGLGCSVGIIRPLLKITEGVAGSGLGMTTGINLDNGDEEIKPKLAELDDNIINPAIGKVLEVVTPFVNEGELIIRPIITSVGPKVLRLFSLMKESTVSDKVELKAAQADEVKTNKLVIATVAEVYAPEMTPIPVQ